jgi:hypothetical protein
MVLNDLMRHQYFLILGLDKSDFKQDFPQNRNLCLEFVNLSNIMMNGKCLINCGSKIFQNAINQNNSFEFYLLKNK